MARLDITETVGAKATAIHAGFTADRVIAGEADLAVQQISELMSVDGHRRRRAISRIPIRSTRTFPRRSSPTAVRRASPRPSWTISATRGPPTCTRAPVFCRGLRGLPDVDLGHGQGHSSHRAVPRHAGRDGSDQGGNDLALAGGGSRQPARRRPDDRPRQGRPGPVGGAHRAVRRLRPLRAAHRRGRHPHHLLGVRSGHRPNARGAATADRCARTKRCSARRSRPASRIGMLATFAPSVATMEEEFRQFAAEAGCGRHARDDRRAGCHRPAAAAAMRMPTTASWPRRRRGSPTTTRSCSRTSPLRGRPNACARRSRRAGPRRTGGRGHAHEEPGRRCPMLIGVIADDFTGASDIANTLAKGGLVTAQYMGVPERRRRPGGRGRRRVAEVAVGAGRRRRSPLRSRPCAGCRRRAAGSSCSSTARPSTRRPRATSGPSRRRWRTRSASRASSSAPPSRRWAAPSTRGICSSAIGCSTSPGCRTTR